MLKYQALKTSCKQNIFSGLIDLHLKAKNADLCQVKTWPTSTPDIYTYETYYAAQQTERSGEADKYSNLIHHLNIMIKITL